jgi:hypothetical protein
MTSKSFGDDFTIYLVDDTSKTIAMCLLKGEKGHNRVKSKGLLKKSNGGTYTKTLSIKKSLHSKV